MTSIMSNQKIKSSYLNNLSIKSSVFSCELPNDDTAFQIASRSFIVK
jgi:hypothetical protein